MTRARNARLLKLYGIDEIDYERMLEFQDGVCAICGRPPAKLRLSVDHSHASGFVRGLLCVNCNRALREWMSVEWLESALAYLLDPPAVQALGRQPQGVVGRITNRRRRRSRRLTPGTNR